ncbi:glutamate-1-semialdehyde 2,1-aminomutase [Mucilaginibacter ginkgonis]|uniref:Glutamate-1-semialdehyde 2,1-aminomutase n=1 Tax=Mucilaginibacter ginkgonis TaxID=2682091 RepID=A0A6I4I6W1_9SPHI|nr:glutamate-1-semialdehyde 2,1-aminomutase [Mucilaginibacter ginkgonis]QQL50840.1 glutamate-1-semialdehyde 2,1-aminomutase [Mucilaginibacter ginkgonis]
MENEDYKRKLNSVIPGGAHTYSRGDDQYPSNAPAILDRGKGAYVWDPSGKKYLDYGMALRAVTLGYADENVNMAAFAQMEKGVNLTRATTLELEAAETMVGLVKGADMVKFAKNGSNVTTAAVKIARAYTGRKYVCVPKQQPFFSFDDWFIGTTPILKGIPAEHHSTTLVFEYNNIASLAALFDAHPGEIAAVIMEPATTLLPTVCEIDGKQTNFLKQVQSICNKNGTVFIIDEMITGFRWHLNGAQAYYGIEPDISTFGKGMANGFAVAALVGKRELMDVGSINKLGSERTFLLSTTHGAEMCGLGAFLETVKTYREQNVIDHLWNFGEKLFNGINQISAGLNIKDFFYMDGNPVSMNYVAKDNEGAVSLGFRTLFSQEMIKNGVLIPWIAPSFMHREEELDFTMDAAEKSLKVVKQALNEGLEKYLVGPSIKPVFRQFN